LVVESVADTVITPSELTVSLAKVSRTRTSDDRTVTKL
jgi:hypothetical protein